MLCQKVLSFALVALFSNTFAAPVQLQAEDLLETRKLIANSENGFSPRDLIVDPEENLSKRQLVRVDANAITTTFSKTKHSKATVSIAPARCAVSHSPKTGTAKAMPVSKSKTVSSTITSAKLKLAAVNVVTTPTQSATVRHPRQPDQSLPVQVLYPQQMWTPIDSGAAGPNPLSDILGGAGGANPLTDILGGAGGAAAGSKGADLLSALTSALPIRAVDNDDDGDATAGLEAREPKKAAAGKAAGKKKRASAAKGGAAKVGMAKSGAAKAGAAKPRTKGGARARAGADAIADAADA